jgi:nicotinamidase-related amidase
MESDYTTPVAARAALLTIDVQRDFADRGAPFEIPGTAALVPRIQALVAAFREAERPVIHVVRLYRRDGSNVDLCRRRAVETGTLMAAPDDPGAELVAPLKPHPGVRLDATHLLSGEPQPIGRREWIVYKPRWSAFFQTPLHRLLHEQGVDSLVVAGCNFPNCPRATIYDATGHDYRVAAVKDAISRIDPRAEDELRAIGVMLFDTESCIEWLGGRLPLPATAGG